VAAVTALTVDRTRRLHAFERAEGGCEAEQQDERGSDACGGHDERNAVQPPSKLEHSKPSARRRRPVAVAWLAAAVVGAASVTTTAGRLSKGFGTPGTAGYDANQHIGAIPAVVISLYLADAGIAGRQALGRASTMLLHASIA